MIPHEEIREKEDRSWTLKLLDLITNSGPEDDLADISETLKALDDPRAVRLMLRIVQDTSQRYQVRRAASEALTSMCIACDEGVRRGWWDSGDWLLQRLAVEEARTSEADLLLLIANDPYHVFHLESIRSLEFGFEEPEFQKLSTRALFHPNPDVRIAAAKNALWCEPIEAEDGLVTALWDTSDCVADDAASTLVWYRSRKAFLGLVEAGRTGPTHRREAAFAGKEYFLDEVRNTLERLEGVSREYFLNWLKPIEEFVPLDEEEIAPECMELSPVPQLPPDGSEQRALLHTASEIIEFYDDVDGCWSNKRYGQVDWHAVNAQDRKILAKYFEQHPDHQVREISCEPLGLWDRGDVLETLLRDACGGVRKRAGYCLRNVTPDPALADSLWKALANVNCTSTCARETLESYVVHAPRDGLANRLADIAIKDKRISRVETAINELDKLGAHTHMRAVLSLLKQPPLINWNIHQYLVAYCVSQKIPVPNFLELCSADDVCLQEELAESFDLHRSA